MGANHEGCEGGSLTAKYTKDAKGNIMKKQTKPDENVKVPEYQRLSEGCAVVIGIVIAHLLLLVVLVIANGK